MANNTDIPDNILDLFSLRISTEDKEKLEHWVNQSDENKKLFLEIRDIWQSTSNVSTDSYDENAAWNKFKPTIAAAKPLSKFTMLKYAAVAIIFCAIGFFAFYFSIHKASKLVSYQEVYVPYGSTSKIVLPDGSYVWLNAGSYLRYSNSFNIDNRDIFLKGEAYFDVRKNKKLNFIVNTPGIEVKAIGTKFNIKSYPEERTIRATVVEGKIQVINKDGEKLNETFLSVNQTASFLKKSPVSAIVEPENSENKVPFSTEAEKIPAEIVEVDSKTSPEIYVSWHQGRLIIERETLGAMAIKLERRYNVKINFLNQSVKNYIFSGVLKDETFEQVLEVIRLTSPLKYSIEGNIVSLMEDKSLKNRLN